MPAASKRRLILRSLKPFLKAKFPKRLQHLQDECKRIWYATREGLPVEQADTILLHFSKIFANIGTQRVGRSRRSWVIVVRWYKCPKCKREFDEREVKCTAEGPNWRSIDCPGCGHVIRLRKGRETR